MVTRNGWAEAPIVREQILLFCPTLDGRIPDDHEVRLLDETLRTLDWSDWEAKFERLRGRPPIHPRILASIWLYGLSQKIKTSRPLERACTHNIDFIWLAEGREPDHSTLATFFTQFKKPLKKLFKQVVRYAMCMGVARLGEIAFDGTRIKASNGRYNTLTGKSLTERIAVVEQEIDALIQQAADAQAGVADADANGPGTTKLPDGLKSLEDRKAKLQEALKRADELDEARRKDGLKTPAQVPMNDLESRVMPNKEGGFAPNYTPTALTDGQCGIILDADVCETVNETRKALPAIDAATEMCGELPEDFLADSAMSTGPVLTGLEERGITGYVPTASSEPLPGSPVLRDDLSLPVLQEHWANLPKNNQGQLDRSNFVYDPEQDAYRCPMGRALLYSDREFRDGAESRRYRCESCEGCPLAKACLKPGSKSGVRTIRRDSYADVRNRMAARMQAEESKQKFNRRSWVAETPFGYLKGVLGLRQFRRVGLEKVKTEWLWACLSLNVKKVLKALAKWRAMANSVLNDLLDETGEEAVSGA